MDLGIPLIEGYGLTECSPVVASQSSAPAQRGSRGWPLPGVDVRIEDPDDEGNGECAGARAQRDEGLLPRSGAYWPRCCATAGSIPEIWEGCCPSGRLKITGRLKTMIATAAGKKVYPEEVEARLSRSPYVLEVAVVGGHGAHAEREGCARARLSESRKARSPGARSGRSSTTPTSRPRFAARWTPLSQALAPYKRARRVIVRREPFPRTATGKIVRQAAIDEERQQQRLA